MPSIDPRGIRRTIKSVTFVPAATKYGDDLEIRYEECDHVGHGNPSMSYTVGAQNFCYSCGLDARVTTAPAFEVVGLVNGQIDSDTNLTMHAEEAEDIALELAQGYTADYGSDTPWSVLIVPNPAWPNTVIEGVAPRYTQANAAELYDDTGFLD